jgi:hypothetical protein
MPGLAIFEGDPEKQAPADEAAAALHAAIGDVSSAAPDFALGDMARGGAPSLGESRDTPIEAVAPFPI